MQFQSRYPDYRDKIRASFDAQSMMRTFGARLTNISPGKCQITAPILQSVRQQHGFAHAALTFALSDSAAGYAALTLMDKQAEVLTVEMKINLIAPADGQRLIASGKVVKSGRRLIIVRAEVAVENKARTTVVALLQGTMIPTT